MAYAKKGGNTVETVRALAEPIAARLGLTIWDVRFLKEGAEWYLRIFIDKPEGVGIDDCEAMSRAINGPLDELDPIDRSYCLEVSSPGLNRELTRPAHFTAFLGTPVQAKLIRPAADGSRSVTGMLESFEDGKAALRGESGELVTVAVKETSSIRVMDDDFVGGIEE